MRTNITLAGLLGVLSVFIIPLLAWGVSVETRLTMHGQRIQYLETLVEKTYTKLEDLKEDTIDILLELKDKKDRNE